MGGFDNQVVVITGAGGNVGKACAAVFAGNGATLALLDRDQDKLNALIAGLPGSGHLGLTTDLISAEATTATLNEVIATLGRIDVIANIAGGFTMGPPLHETPEKDWNFMFDLNARSIYNTCQAVVPQMLKQGSGRIINVAARAALKGVGGMGPYCASKAAVITLTETLADEHRDNGITANCIMPGTVDTPENREAMPDAEHDRWVPTAALADVVLFLASDAARCVTGAAVPVYGRS